MSSIASRREFLQGASRALALLFFSPVNASALQASSEQTSLLDQIHSLKPGAFLWAPLIAPSGPLLVVISLPVQRSYVYRNGVLIGVATISTGKPGHVTPTGIFTVLQKQVRHRSNLYDSAPMPFMERLTWTGVAMHAGNLPGYPASHGCIRMPPAFARLLYQETALGMTVVITDVDSVPRVAPTPDILKGESETSTLETGNAVWQPDKASVGPVSLIISSADSRLVVLRNGILIGSAPVQIAGKILETTAYSLSKIDQQGFHWLQLPLPGQSWDGQKDLSAADRARVSMPDSFRKSLDAVLTPGVTLVVTEDSLRAGETGQKLTVLDTKP